MVKDAHQMFTEPNTTLSNCSLYGSKVLSYNESLKTQTCKSLHHVTKVALTFTHLLKTTETSFKSLKKKKKNS